MYKHEWALLPVMAAIVWAAYNYCVKTPKPQSAKPEHAEIAIASARPDLIEAKVVTEPGIIKRHQDDVLKELNHATQYIETKAKSNESSKNEIAASNYKRLGELVQKLIIFANEHPESLINDHSKVIISKFYDQLQNIEKRICEPGNNDKALTICIVCGGTGATFVNGEAWAGTKVEMHLKDAGEFEARYKEEKRSGQNKGATTKR